MTSSYTTDHGKLASRLRQIKYLWAFQTAGAAKDVAQMLEEAKSLSSTLKAAYGFESIGKDILEIGPGQFLTQARYFALQNNVTAIDSDVIAEYLSLGNFSRMVRQNGSSRTLKTCVRKFAGIDRIYRNTTRRELKIQKLPKIKIEHGDVAAMPFADASFDMIQCRSVFHHLPHPEKALSEISRVLRLGGVAHIDLHLYSSYNGALDPRTMSGSDSTHYWAHLRQPDEQADMAALNKLTLKTWRELFARLLPGSTVRVMEEGPAVRDVALRLQSDGELYRYSVEELLAHALDVLWQKPFQSIRA